MKSFLKNTIEWLAQRLIIQAATRATEMLEEAAAHRVPKSLPAPSMPEVELH